ENVYPVEIESVLAEDPSVLTVAVVGLPDEHWGEVVVAAVELAPGATLDEESLRRRCRERLASYKVPIRIHAFDALPKSMTGKVQKHLVVDLISRLGGDD
ncbi:MAG TPA: long-chain fatty acid--CoA ligase, partial [Agromyces sp.]